MSATDQQGTTLDTWYSRGGDDVVAALGSDVQHGLSATVAAERLGRDGPNAITPHLYWRTTTGTCYLQRALRLGRGTRFLPSPEFVECMVQLQKRRSNEAGT